MQRQLILISLLLVLLISACSKRTVDLEAVKYQDKISSKSDSTFVNQVKKELEQKKVSIYDQENDYQVDITPDGDFHFDPKTGFTGKAKSISIKGKSKNKGQITEQNSAKTDSLQSTDVKKQQEAKKENESKIKNTKSQGFRWPTFLFLLAAIAIVAFSYFKIYPWLQLFLKKKGLV